jgi:hypothetical protein
MALGVTGYFCADTQTEKSNNSAVNMLDVFILKLSIINYQLSTMGDSASGWLNRISESLKANPTSFEALRKAYPLRGE